MQTRYFIMAQGEGKRWNNYLGIPKHEVVVDGEMLLERTVRLLKERGEQDIIICTPKQYDFAKCVEYPNNDLEIDRFLASQKAWVDGENVFLYGDCFYTEDAMDVVLGYHKPYTKLLFFGRSTGSRVTGSRHGEVFAVRSACKEYLKELLESLRSMYLNKSIKRAQGWELYRIHKGLNLSSHKIVGDFVTIDDWTDDFDTPEDYERFIKRYEIRNKR
jgi:hypothetical protein